VEETAFFDQRVKINFKGGTRTDLKKRQKGHEKCGNLRVETDFVDTPLDLLSQKWNEQARQKRQKRNQNKIAGKKILNKRPFLKTLCGTQWPGFPGKRFVRSIFLLPI